MTVLALHKQLAVTSATNRKRIHDWLGGSEGGSATPPEKYRSPHRWFSFVGETCLLARGHDLTPCLGYNHRQCERS
jgi:hypothetical protein